MRSNPESSIVKRIQIAASAAGSRLFRNNVGKLQDRNGTWIAYGLCPGSADLIGWTPVRVTPDMVGQLIAIFTAIEAKTAKGEVSEVQKNFLGVVTQSGGISFVARSEFEALKFLRGYLGKNT